MIIEESESDGFLVVIISDAVQGYLESHGVETTQKECHEYARKFVNEMIEYKQNL